MRACARAHDEWKKGYIINYNLIKIVVVVVFFRVFVRVHIYLAWPQTFDCSLLHFQ